VMARLHRGEGMGSRARAGGPGPTFYRDEVGGIPACSRDHCGSGCMGGDRSVCHREVQGVTWHRHGRAYGKDGTRSKGSKIGRWARWAEGGFEPGWAHGRGPWAGERVARHTQVGPGSSFLCYFFFFFLHGAGAASIRGFTEGALGAGGTPGGTRVRMPMQRV